MVVLGAFLNAGESKIDLVRLMTGKVERSATSSKMTITSTGRKLLYFEATIYSQLLLSLLIHPT